MNFLWCRWFATSSASTLQAIFNIIIRFQATSNVHNVLRFQTTRQSQHCLLFQATQRQVKGASVDSDMHVFLVCPMGGTRDPVRQVRYPPRGMVCAALRRQYTARCIFRCKSVTPDDAVLAHPLFWDGLLPCLLRLHSPAMNSSTCVQLATHGKC